jgi:hypothetical protein
MAKCTVKKKSGVSPLGLLPIKSKAVALVEPGAGHSIVPRPRTLMRPNIQKQSISPIVGIVVPG